MNKPISTISLQTLRFDNTFVSRLPADPITKNSRRQVTGACYSFVKPRKARKPQLVCYSKEAAEILDISPSDCETTSFTDIFTGNTLLPGMNPFSMCYGGHQFGSWAGQLGDGRAINLGEIINNRNQRWTMQLKGAGETPYSRNADGLAVLRSSIREFLCSEAMHHLGIPTTRALSITTTGDMVVRDMFYDGNPREEQGAVVCRLSPSWLRFGSYEIFTSRKEYNLLKNLVDYTITTDFPHLDTSADDIYLQWFGEVCKRTAEMIVHWMRVGFVHGVMNTDNMSILGLTIDYGPYGWIENYDPTWTPNTTDAHGRRYCFANQPKIAQWNLVQLANAIYPIIKDEKGLSEALDQYHQTFQQQWANCTADKLGFQTFLPQTDGKLVEDLYELLTVVETDMTIFFRILADYQLTVQKILPNKPTVFFNEAYYKPDKVSQEYEKKLQLWLSHYSNRLSEDTLDPVERKKQMNRTNPKYILRNYLAQLAIEKAENGDFSLVNDLLEVIRHPYDEQPAMEKYAVKRPEWARHKAGCSMLSCSS